ncbi:MAG: YfiR family protein [Chthoniobacterales bacterium]
MEFLRRVFSLVAFLLGLVFALAPLPAAPPSPNEYALKSVFLYNFCRFIDWPDSAFSSRRDPLIIGVVGEDPFGPLLEEAIAGETYHGREIEVAHFRDAQQIGECHLLFVGQTNTELYDQILAAVVGRHVVTVGETDNFLDHGGMIALTAEQNRVRLRINSAALRATRLNVSSKLLQVADIRL